MKYVSPLLHSSWARRNAWLVLASVALLTVVACAPSTAPPGTNSTAASGATQVRDGGQVSVTVTWKGPEAGPVFEVAMDTHSVDLDSLDLGRLATLKTPSGELAASGWSAPGGGHHRAGTLTFAATAGDGSPTIGNGPVDLVIRDVAGVPERTFQWQP